MSRAGRNVFAAVAGLAVLAAVVAALYISARRSAPAITLAELIERYATPASRYVDVAGVRVHYRDEGSGPTLLLFHGSFGSLLMFDEMVPALAGRFRVIRFDQPPTGLSGPVPDGFSMTPEAFVREFLGRLGVDRVALLGTSSGGIFAYRYAGSSRCRARPARSSRGPGPRPAGETSCARCSCATSA